MAPKRVRQLIRSKSNQNFNEKDLLFNDREASAMAFRGQERRKTMHPSGTVSEPGSPRPPIERTASDGAHYSPWLRMHLQQQTILLRDFLRERNQLRVENRRLLSMLRDAEVTIHILRGKASRYQEEVEKLRKQGNQRSVQDTKDVAGQQSFPSPDRSKQPQQDLKNKAEGKIFFGSDTSSDSSDDDVTEKKGVRGASSILQQRGSPPRNVNNSKPSSSKSMPEQRSPQRLHQQRRIPLLCSSSCSFDDESNGSSPPFRSSYGSPERAPAQTAPNLGGESKADFGWVNPSQSFASGESSSMASHSEESESSSSSSSCDLCDDWEGQENEGHGGELSLAGGSSRSFVGTSSMVTAKISNRSNTKSFDEGNKPWNDDYDDEKEFKENNRRAAFRSPKGVQSTNALLQRGPERLASSSFSERQALAANRRAVLGGAASERAFGKATTAGAGKFGRDTRKVRKTHGETAEF